MDKIKNVVVVGAGTAGWLVASSIKRHCSNINVQIIYDSKIPTVGVGETLGFNMPSVLKELLTINDDEWFDKTDAIYKTAIIFEDWKHQGSSELMPHFLEFDADMLFDPDNFTQLVEGNVYKESNGPNITDIWYTMYRTGRLDREFSSFPMHGGKGYHFAKNNKSIRALDGEWLMDSSSGYSYQYDAELVGKTIGELVGKPAGVVHTDSTLVDVICDDTGVKSLTLANGDTIQNVDLYIDCSGFNRLLMSKLDNEWINFSEFYNNSALVTQVQYDKKDDHPLHSFRPVTVLAAMNHGWRFGVSTRSRVGNGYMFNSRQTTDVDSLADEFRSVIGVESSQKVRQISWDPGYYKNILHKNCFALGLSMGFGDPFDANNLALATKMLKNLISGLEKDNINASQINIDAERMWGEIDLRVRTNLMLSPRRDTEHYRLMSQVALDTKLKEEWFEHINTRRQDYFKNRADWVFPLRVHIVLALRYGIELPITPVDEKYFPLVNSFFNRMDSYWSAVANSAPTSEEYYRNRFNS